uniref:Putative c2h2-type zn-finger protein n=1 Tax=Ixodes ricinus TaxID=34613 RepID=A0A0K8RMK4_IXORI
MGFLVFHERMHESDQLHKCSTCGKRFTGNLRCTSHQVGPKVVKCFMCLTCSKAFQWNSHLNIHKRMHTIISPSHCPPSPPPCRPDIHKKK